MRTKNKFRGEPGFPGAVLAMAAALAAAPAFGLAETPALSQSGTQQEAASAAAGPDAGEPAPATRLTRGQVEAAIQAAEKRRAEAMRPDPSVPASVAEQWGVEVIRVASTAGGFWLDFRFRVMDVEKSLPLFDSRIKPYLESELTGVKLGVPSAAKVGSLRTTNRGANIKPDKIYTILFSNPGFHVKPGQKVSVVIGDFRAEHLTVN